MTFQTACYAVDGNAENGNFLRLMLMSGTQGSQGVVGHLDCIVKQTTVASSGLIITSGAVVVLGQETAFQGSYFGYNVGNDTTLTIAPTGGTGRSDMVVVRAEDPTWSGSPWGGPASGQILFPRVISGVSGSATTAPAGISAIPLARIDIPASTTAITQAMITDLRQVSNPQRTLALNAVNGPSVATNWTLSGSTAINWPTGATWQVQIPLWATNMVVSWSANELLYGNDGDNIARGWLWAVIGSNVNAPVVSTRQSLVSMNASTGPWRHTIGGGDSISIPASIRGTTQTIQIAQIADPSHTSHMKYDEGSGVTILTEFQQLAAAA